MHSPPPSYALLAGMQIEASQCSGEGLAVLIHRSFVGSPSHLRRTPLPQDDMRTTTQIYLSEV
jgi:hypothetical protein